VQVKAKASVTQQYAGLVLNQSGLVQVAGVEEEADLIRAKLVSVALQQCTEFLPVDFATLVRINL
jgi:hypothetical protein